LFVCLFACVSVYAHVLYVCTTVCVCMCLFVGLLGCISMHMIVYIHAKLVLLHVLRYHT